jgi:DNA-binding MarR family transcriptional regulator
VALPPALHDQRAVNLAKALEFDKTALTSLLDRLKADLLIVRTLDPHDRRARIPELTVQETGPGAGNPRL